MSLASVQDFRCSACIQSLRALSNKAIEKDDGIIGGVEKIIYLGDVLDRECSVDAAVKARISTAWVKWRKINGLLCNRGISFKRRPRLYEACIRSVMFYGSETWSSTKKLGIWFYEGIVK